MTAQEHYREAERLLGWAAEQDLTGEYTVYDRKTARVEAQVHATLALAAALGEGRRVDWGQAPLESGGRPDWTVPR
jgi:hypothetical protein